MCHGDYWFFFFDFVQKHEPNKMLMLGYVTHSAFTLSAAQTHSLFLQSFAFW